MELNKNIILNKIEKRKEDLKKLEVKQIGLFGSFVKNKQTKKSDVDFLVEFNNITADNFFDLMDLLEKIFKRKIDLVIEKDLRPELSYVKNEAEYAKI